METIIMSNVVLKRSFTNSFATQINRQLQQKRQIRGYSGILLRLKNFLVKHGDPLIAYNLHGYDIELPLSHKLPDILRSYPLYSANLGRVANHVYQKYSDMTFIDVGANVGDSIAILRELSDFPILCVDGDTDFLEVLRKNVKRFHDVDVAPFFIGDEEVTVNAKSSGMGGTAHLTFVPELENSNKIRIKTLDGILGQYARFSKSKMMKIDTDGFDCKIIRGATEFLRQAKPVLFFEYDPFFLKGQGDDGLSTFSLLKENGYSGLLIYDNFGDLMICLPEINMERLEELHLYFSGRDSAQYYDMCAFHAEDRDVFDAARTSELEFFRSLKP
jgi:FkbM family methyltransferase